jgi:hypothetical protein
LLLLAAALQSFARTSADVSWLITICEKTLDGERPYVDFIETNPPAAFLIYMPAVISARVLGAPAEFMAAFWAFVAIAASLAASAALLSRIDAARRLGQAGAFAGVAALALLPGHVFDQREHFAVIASLPMLAAFAARASGARPPLGVALGAGLGAALAVAIKPHFVLFFLPVLPYVCRRAGWRTIAASPEVVAASLLGLAYVLATVVFFPAFLEKVAPVAAAVYAPLRQPWYVLALNPGVVLCVLLGAFIRVGDPARRGDPVIVVAALAGIGALVSFLIQGKGWPYQSYPAVAFMMISFLIAAEAGRQRALMALILIAVPLVALAEAFSVPLSWLVALVASTAVAALAAQALASGYALVRWTIAPATACASLAAFLLAGLLFLQDAPVLSSLEGKIVAIAPHPRIVALTQDIALGFPLTRDVGGSWVQRPNMLWVTHDATRLIEERPADATLAERLAPFMRVDRDMLVEDIRRGRPDIVLIDNRGQNFHQWAFADQKVVDVLSTYRLAAVDATAHGPIEIYKRVDAERTDEVPTRSGNP